ncbi:MAG: malto-oligosyltrehalose synthase [Candidatus Dormibacteria bacterium]
MTAAEPGGHTALAPRATYRVQLGPGFGLAAAQAILAYLHRLGISHLYSSPYLQAGPGSTHGYDIVDPHRVSDGLGGKEELQLLRTALRDRGMGEVLDIVPNHLAVGGRENRWWWDVLARGPASPYAHYFDIDWNPPDPSLRGRLLVPVLSGHYGRLVGTGEIRLVRDGASVEVGYLEWRLPLSARSVIQLLQLAGQRLGLADPALTAAVMAAATAPATGGDAAGEVGRATAPAAPGIGQVPGLSDSLDAILGEINRDPEQLDGLLQLQHYQLAHRRSANRNLNYRRFFDITTLAGLRVEDPGVFADRHRLLLEWLGRGEVSALRVDHIDGLWDPQEYLSRLRRASPGAWVLTEKILGAGEHIPNSWPVAGTTGYDFLRLVGGVLVDRRGEEPLAELYCDFTGEQDDFATVRQRAKLEVLSEVFGSELGRLTSLLGRICAKDRRARDYNRSELQEALLELAASFPVYRTYVEANSAVVDADSAARIAQAVEAARERRPDLEPGLLALLQDLLLGSAPNRPERELLLRLQQLTGPVMAKGVEDTAFYRYHRLISLNEVGDDPGQFGVSPEAFHRAMEWRQRHWPMSLNATSTHDTKRSEDVRVRIHLLSEIPELWGTTARRWASRNRRHRRGGMPSRNDEYYLYQTLVGAWPISWDRLSAVLVKSAREAKRHTSWQSPEPGYEQALLTFADACLGDPVFGADLEGFVAGLVEPGRVNSLAQTLIKLTAPGVPDIYQGTELWDHSLVDPDNRRTVDYGVRQRLLAELEGSSPAAIMARSDTGLPKLWVTRTALQVRARAAGAFGPQGSYRAIRAVGPRAEHVLAFARSEQVVTVVPRLGLRLGGRWEGTTLPLPPGRWRSELDGRSFEETAVAVADLLSLFPVALLTKT